MNLKPIPKKIEKILQTKDLNAHKQLFIELRSEISLFFGPLFFNLTGFAKRPGLENLPKEQSFLDYCAQVFFFRKLAKTTLTYILNLRYNKASNTFLNLLHSLEAETALLLIASHLKTIFYSIDKLTDEATMFRRLSSLYPSLIKRPSEDIKFGNFLYKLITRCTKPLRFEQVIENMNNTIHTYTVYKLNPTWLKNHGEKHGWIYDFKKFVSHEQRLPMVFYPARWTEDKPLSGGYLLNELIGINWIKPSPSGDHDIGECESISGLDINEKKLIADNLIETLNDLNSVPYRVNRDLLKIINANLNLLDQDERRQLQQFNQIANQTFFFQHQVDFRGRIYPYEYDLHPMSGPFAKAIVEFALPDSLDSLNGLRRYTAAIFDPQSRTLSNRDLLISFQQNFQKKFQNEFHKTPPKNLQNIYKSWNTPKLFWLMVRLLIEWAHSRLNFTHLPIYYDSTASLFQCSALLTGDFGFLEELNLEEQDPIDSHRGDLYTTLIEDYLTSVSFPTNDQMLNLLRKVLKPLIVATLYGLGRFGFYKKINETGFKNQLKDICDMTFCPTDSFVETLTGFWDWLQILAPFEYLKQFQIATKYSPDFIWNGDFSFSPLYLKERQISYSTSEPIITKNKCSMRHKRKQLIYTNATGGTNLSSYGDRDNITIALKQSQRSIGANLLQSIDALLMRRFIISFASLTRSIVPIHDSWGFQPDSMYRFFYCIKAAIVEVQDSELRRGRVILFMQHFNDAFDELEWDFDEFEELFNRFANYFYEVIEESAIGGSYYLVTPSV